MRILTDIHHYQPAKKRPLFLGIGNFDGFHLGHQELLKRVLSEARAQNGIPAVLTFRTHPQHVLHPEHKPTLLMTPEYKRVLLQRAGIELCFELEFTPEFSQIDPVVFVRDWLHQRLQVREVCMGYNARFGKGRKGDGALMALLSRELGFEFSRIAPVHAAGQSVSSSRIRDLIKQGNLNDATACLGRPFSLMAGVVHGAGRGKDLGFPTANLEHTAALLPPCGVYTAWTRQMEVSAESPGPADSLIQIKQGQWFKSVLNLGFRPTFHEHAAYPSLEVFILNASGINLYDKSLEVVFDEFLRPEKEFSSPEALVRQIEKDVQKGRQMGKNPSSAVKNFFTKP